MSKSIISIALFLACLAPGAAVVVAGSKQGLRAKGSSFISSLQFKHQLRVCNAYPYSLPMDIYLGKEKLTEAAMPYKECAEFAPTLKAGDKLDFKVGDSSAGSFSVSDLPENDAVLVLVIYRHDTMSTAVSFDSHVFASLDNAQIAVLDTYRGAAKAMPHIQDMKAQVGKEKEQRSEELRYDSVVAVNPGVYEVVLEGSDGKNVAKHELVALNRKSYVVIRCGVEAAQGKAYPQDIMVFPKSDRSALGGAPSKQPLFVVVLAALFALFSQA